MRRSVVAIFSISIIMFCLVFLMWMNVKGIDMPFGKEEISKEVLMNTEYKELKIGEDTMIYPSFLDIKSETDDCVELESDDKKVVMTFKRYIPNGTIDSEYKRELNELDNITYKGNENGTSYVVSGYEGEDNIYYNRYVRSNEYVSGVEMIYPEEFESEFDSIVSTVVDSINSNKKYGKDGSSNNSTVNQSNEDLYAGTIKLDKAGTNDYKYPGLKILGKYEPNKSYDDIEYGLIVGKNLENSKNINDSLEYNKATHYWGTMTYPDFMKPYYVPGNYEGFSFKTEGDYGLMMNMSFTRNSVAEDYPYTPETEYNKIGKSTNITKIIDKEINGDYLYYSIQYRDNDTGKEYVQKFINYYTSKFIVEVFMEIDLDYYNHHKNKIEQIYEHEKQTFKPDVEGIIENHG